MESDQPSGGGRAAKRHRSLVIVMGLAIALIGGVVVIGMIPTGDRAGTTTSDPSVSAGPSAEATSSAEATTEATSSAEATTEATASPSASTSASASASASASPAETAIVLTCAEGGDCAVGDVGPGGGTIIYVKAEGFTCGESRDDQCTTLEAGTVTYGQLCSINKPYLLAWSPGMSQGAWLGDKSKDSCQGGLLSSVRASTEGGKSDWFVGSKVEVSKAVEQEVLLGVDGLGLWTVDQGRYTNTAYIWYGITDLWQDYFATTGFAYVIPMRTF